ncbi:MAG: sulfite exporter TauE/SafE family protein [Phormidesmis sp.]
MPDADLAIVVITCAAAFTQGVSGFGFGLVAVPILLGIVGPSVVTPLVALCTLTINSLLWIYYRRSFDGAVVGKLLAGAVVGIPLGFWVLQYVPAAGILTALGLMIVAYSLYSLTKPKMPVLKSPYWIYLTGFLSGTLMGSYNLPGPPVILYGDSQSWPQKAFKGNLTGFFWSNGVLAVVGHSLQQRITEALFHQYLSILPGIIIGLFAGVALSSVFNPMVFRSVVLFILIGIGVRLFIVGIQT